jgi:hypothetical protein
LAGELIEKLLARFDVESLFEANDPVVPIARTVGAGDASVASVTWRWDQSKFRWCRPRYRFRSASLRRCLRTTKRPSFTR